MAVSTGMQTRTPSWAKQADGYEVRGPRSTDAIGAALRGAFHMTCLPADMQAALNKLGGTPSR